MSHIGAYYKLKVSLSTNAKADPTDRKLLDDFDDWYTDYNVENIMLKRMISKNEKKIGVPTNQNDNNNNTTTANSLTTSIILDPQPGPQIKKEPKEAAEDQRMSNGEEAVRLSTTQSVVPTQLIALLVIPAQWFSWPSKLASLTTGSGSKKGTVGCEVVFALSWSEAIRAAHVITHAAGMI